MYWINLNVTFPRANLITLEQVRKRFIVNRLVNRLASGIFMDKHIHTTIEEISVIFFWFRIKINQNVSNKEKFVSVMLVLTHC